MNMNVMKNGVMCMLKKIIYLQHLVLISISCEILSPVNYSSAYKQLAINYFMSNMTLCLILSLIQSDNLIMRLYSSL